MLSGRLHCDLKFEKQTLGADSEEPQGGKKNTLHFSSSPCSGTGWLSICTPCLLSEVANEGNRNPPVWEDKRPRLAISTCLKA